MKKLFLIYILVTSSLSYAAAPFSAFKQQRHRDNSIVHPVTKVHMQTRIIDVYEHTINMPGVISTFYSGTFNVVNANGKCAMQEIEEGDAKQFYKYDVSTKKKVWDLFIIADKLGYPKDEEFKFDRLDE